VTKKVIDKEPVIDTPVGNGGHLKKKKAMLKGILCLH